MNIHLENVNLGSSSGPNSFANKLVKYLSKDGCTFNSQAEADLHLCFIEANKRGFEKPMIQRLDGIYFNSMQDYKAQNANIKRTYDMADGVVFQSEFNRQLITKYFGEHKNSTVIHNGADIETIKETPELKFHRYENLWSCASSWRPHKRLDENIRYFLEHSGEKDGLMVAGNVDPFKRKKYDRVHYVGELNQKQLFALYKRSKYFLHLAWLDHCPNVVVDARASGCQIICSSAGGTREIAGPNAIVVKEPEWDFEPVRLYEPPKMDFQNKTDNTYNSEYDMVKVSKMYKEFCGGIL